MRSVRSFSSAGAVFRRFIEIEGIGSYLLLAAAVLAMIIANSPLNDGYQAARYMKLAIGSPPFGLALSLEHWVNDAGMALFFLLVGLELKREALQGELSRKGQMLLPLAAALGGMAIPAVVYLTVIGGDAALVRGWAIPAATDIAFALGVLMALGKRVPLGLKVLLTSIAVIDDLGAIIIIALFYTQSLALPYLLAALGLFLLLLMLNKLGVWRVWPYLLIGVALWYATYKSGVHATLAGVMLALTIPLQQRGGRDSALLRLEHGIHPWVTFLVVPVFAFLNAGVPLSGDVAGPLPAAVALGLVVGKPVGILGTSLLLTKLRLARLPDGVDQSQMAGLALLCGIGFTMSLFIGGLAFPDKEHLDAVRIGILGGSLVSAIAGYLVLNAALPRQNA